MVVALRLGNDSDLKPRLKASPGGCAHIRCCRLHASLRSFLRMFLGIGGWRVVQAFQTLLCNIACMWLKCRVPVQEYYLSVLLAPRPGRAGSMMAFSSDVDLAKLGSSGSDTDGQLKKPAAFSTQLYNSLVHHHIASFC